MPLPSKYAAIDTETTALAPWLGGRVFSAAAAFPDGRRLFWRGEFSGLRELLADGTVDKVFHNAKFDCRMLRNEGYEINGKVWDTMILCHLLDGRDAGKHLALEHVTRKYLPTETGKVVREIDQWFADNGYDRKIAKANFDRLPPDLLKRRNVGDTHLTLKLFERLFVTVSAYFPFLLEQEHRLLSVVEKMEDRGISVDFDELNRQRQEFTDIIEDVRQYCEGALGCDYFNFDSREQQMDLLRRAGLMEVLKQNVRHDKSRRTKKGMPKLDDYNLRTLHHPVAHMLLLGKASSKMRGTFLAQASDLAVDGVLHASFNQLGTTTGRFSCSGPNLQNIPIEGDRRTAYTEEEAEEAFDITWTTYAPHIKRNFLVRPGYAHIHSDKKQAEMVMLAHYTQDQGMIDIFNSGVSIHDGICQRLYGEITKGLKTRTKAVVFGFQYGAGLPVIARKIGGTIAEARAIKGRLAEVLPTLPAWRNHLDRLVAHYGYVQTDHGRRHYLRGDENYIAVNRMCQGSVGDEIKSRMVAIDDFLVANGIDGRVLLNIHDDICTEVAIDEVEYVTPHIHRIMHETSIPYRLPLPSSMDISYTRWSDLQEIKDVFDYPSYARTA